MLAPLFCKKKNMSFHFNFQAISGLVWGNNEQTYLLKIKAIYIYIYLHLLLRVLKEPICLWVTVNSELHPVRVMPSCTWIKYSPRRARVRNTDILYNATNKCPNETFVRFLFLNISLNSFVLCLVKHIQSLWSSIVVSYLVCSSACQTLSRQSCFYVKRIVFILAFTGKMIFFYKNIYTCQFFKFFLYFYKLPSK